MARLLISLPCALALLVLAASPASAAVVEQTFYVQNLTVNRLCHEQAIIAVNGRLPGPTINALEGDTLIIHVINKSPSNVTIHWHGVFQLYSGWADGTEYVTQCPILPGNKYTYRFKITGQEGTLFWHAHINYLRATVHGAIVIRPPPYRSYPFPKPYREVPIVLGEYWNANVLDVVDQMVYSGGLPNMSDTHTLNGWPGDLGACPSKQNTFRLKVIHGKTYLLRIINAAINNQLFFKIANHNMTVVAVDASYTEPYLTDLVVIAPGQTVDVLLIADQPPAQYYMAARPYDSLPRTIDNTTATGIIIYDGAPPSNPILPILPPVLSVALGHGFYRNLTSLLTGPYWEPVPQEVDVSMFVTAGLGYVPCVGNPNATCRGFVSGTRNAASMNNESWVFPTRMSLLEASFNHVSGIYTTDFPDRPPVEFDYTNRNISVIAPSLLMTKKSTKVRKVKFNSTVEVVFQNTALIVTEDHPMHLHGFDFYVMAEGFGNFDPVNDPKKFNLLNPQKRNTVVMPVAGWVAIRFRANNPGLWFSHCHMDIHLPWGMNMAFEVENGPTPSTRLPPPPPDLPHC